MANIHFLSENSNFVFLKPIQKKMFFLLPLSHGNHLLLSRKVISNAVHTQENPISTADTRVVRPDDSKMLLKHSVSYAAQPFHLDLTLFLTRNLNM